MFSLRFHLMWNCLRDVFLYSQHTWKENRNRGEMYSWAKTCVKNFSMMGWRSDKLIKRAGNAHYGLSHSSSCEAPPSPLQWFYCSPKPAGSQEKSSWPCICPSAGCNQAWATWCCSCPCEVLLAVTSSGGRQRQGKPGVLCRPGLCTILEVIAGFKQNK